MAGKSYQVGFVFGAKKASSFDNTFKGIKASLSSIGKAAVVGIGVGTAAAGAAVIKLGSTVIKQFGELEQNLGGSEAVFGQYAARIQKTGEDAYKNLGVSQSDYLATANKMGALFQGSGIEQMKSLDLTEKAMQRAADMASVMGIDMQIALDSVAGAAKGNFTMMDNLGVAMNATNIEAYALAKGLSFTWKTASQAQKAEVAMQMFFDSTTQYAGNFARESTQTITGSVGLWKAAVSSFTAGLGNPNADMKKLTGNVIDAFKTVAANAIPVFKNMGSALPDALISAFPKARPIIERTTSFVKNAFYKVRDTGQRTIELVKGKWEQYGPSIIAFFINTKNKAISAFTSIRDTGQRAIAGIQEKYVEIKPYLESFIGAVMDAGNMIQDKLQGGFEMAKPVIEWVAVTGFPAVVGAAGMVLGEAADIYYFFKTNWPTIKGIVTGIGIAFAAWNLPNVLAGGINTIFTLSSALVAIPGKVGAVTTSLWGMVGAKIADKVETLQLVGLYAKDFAMAAAGALKTLALNTGAWIANTAQLVGQKVALVALKGAQLISTGVTTAMTAAQWALNAAFVASPVGWVVLAIGALIAVGVLLYKNWDTIKAKTIELWSTFSEKFPMLAQIVSGPIEAIKGLIGGLKQTFFGIIDFVAGVFTGDWTRAWEGVKGIFGGIFHSFASLAKTPINAVIAIINGAIRGINKINVDVPDWVPVLGGKSYGFSIPEILMLAKGGIATKPTFAMIGEGRENEAIMPLSKLQDMLNFNTGPIAALIEKFLSLTSGVGHPVGAGSGSEPVQFIYNPQNVFHGPVDRDMIESVQKDDYNRFVRFIKQYERDKKRKGLNT